MYKKIIFGTLLTFVCLGNSHANSEYLVARVGAMLINTANTKPLLASGLYYGYGLDERTAIEAEANIGLAGGKYNQGDGNFGSFDVWTIAAYGVYRYPFTHNFYAKTKLGLLYENVTNNTREKKLPQRDYGVSGGIGLGLRFKQALTLEAEFTLLEQNIFYSGMGIHYQY
ncbi:MAG: porin family protein [Gammaproteobacteria bacterium]|nr:porin family protein [Gammaproteobacteria bacterium]